MAQLNCTRNGCKDVFRAFLVENADYDGYLEIPWMKIETQVPKKLIPFSKSLGTHDYGQWVHFYEDDSAFERIWNNPRKYLSVLRRFDGVISPDFSLYRDMPLAMQLWNTYRGRAIGHWLQEQGVSAIPNIRFGDKRSFEFCCRGVPSGGTIAVGSHGCIRLAEDLEYFTRGLEYAVSELNPRTIVVYGAAPNNVFAPYRKRGIEIIEFESDFNKSRKVGSA